MFKAKIHVDYKKSVLDPKAEVIQATLKRLGDTAIKHVSVGKYFELLVDSTDESEAHQLVDHICDEMLTNVNIETYCFELEELAVAQ